MRQTPNTANTSALESKVHFIVSILSFARAVGTSPSQEGCPRCDPTVGLLELLTVDREGPVDLRALQAVRRVGTVEPDTDLDVGGLARRQVHEVHGARQRREVDPGLLGLVGAVLLGVDHDLHLEGVLGVGQVAGRAQDVRIADAGAVVEGAAVGDGEEVVLRVVGAEAGERQVDVGVVVGDVDDDGADGGLDGAVLLAGEAGAGRVQEVHEAESGGEGDGETGDDEIAIALAGRGRSHVGGGHFCLTFYVSGLSSPEGFLWGYHQTPLELSQDGECDDIVGDYILLNYYCQYFFHIFELFQYPLLIAILFSPCHPNQDHSCNHQKNKDTHPPP